MTAPRPERDLDLVVHGATGFTGRLVARGVRDRAPAGLRWGLSGRNEAKLRRIRDELGLDPQRVPVIVADAFDSAALAALAGRARAVVTTVGPYARYGRQLVAACALAGTDLADLTGEPLFMRDTILLHHATARATGARIVHACGFDSVPSDLGAYALQREAVRRHGRPCREVVHLFGPLSGGVSGGTIASLFDLADLVANDPDARRALQDPDLLAPGGSPSRPAPWGLPPARHDGFAGWSAPFVMAATNEKVVRRSRFLRGEPWGPEVRYVERFAAATWARAAAVGLGTVALMALLAVPPLRRLAARLAPKPGAGPSDRTRADGFFRTTLIGRVPDVSEPIVAHVRADEDPGYAATARMLAEFGLLLAAGESDAEGGVLTPAVAGGARAIERLAEVGIEIRVEPPAGSPTRVP